MYRALSVVKFNLRYNLLPQIGAAIALLMLTPVLFSITALDPKSAAYPLELCLPLIGVILFTPVYEPEQETGILDTVRARKTPYLFICVLRIMLMMIMTVFFICVFVLLMSALECEVLLAHGLASCANAIFLGGLGILGTAISSHVVFGYILPILYYGLDLTGGLKDFTIFTMMRKGTMEGKGLIFIIGLCCIAASIGCLQLRLRRR
jgi:hypothetical protein